MTIHIMAGKANKTLAVTLCNLPGNVRLDCSIILKHGLLPQVIVEFPNNRPRDEYTNEILLRKKELPELTELTDGLYATMEDVFTRTPYRPDLITEHVIEQLVAGWSCDAENVTCAKTEREVAAVRYAGALF